MQNGPADEGYVKAKVKPKVKLVNLRYQMNHLKIYLFKAKKPIIRSSAEVNRRKQQAKIDYENAILQKKLDKIALRRPK